MPTNFASYLGELVSNLSHMSFTATGTSRETFAYDSQYTRECCDVDAATPLPQKNMTVVAVCRRLIREAAELGIVVVWAKVRGHSVADPADATVVGNDCADKAADKGQEGKRKGGLHVATYMYSELGQR